MDQKADESQGGPAITHDNQRASGWILNRR